MLYAKLETDDTLYVFLHAEQIYHNFGLCDNDLGFSNHELAESTICDIYKYIEKKVTPENIIIDCAEIEEAYNIAEGVEKIIKYCKEHGKNLSFCRMSETLYEKSRIHGKGLAEQSNDDRTYNVFRVCLNFNLIIC